MTLIILKTEAVGEVVVWTTMIENNILIHADSPNDQHTVYMHRVDRIVTKE